MSAVGGSLRLARERLAQLRPSQQPADGYDAVVLAADAPLGLASFQDWLCFALPPSVHRLKGFVWLAHERGAYRELQLSGRRRLHVSEARRWERSPETSLVVIGRGLDAVCLLDAFEELKTRSPSYILSPKVEISGISDSIQLLSTEQANRLRQEHQIVSFRYQPPVRLSDDADIRFGVDLDQLQLQIATAVNADVHHMLLLTHRLDESKVVLQWALGGRLPAQDLFDLVLQHGRSLAQQAISEMHICPRSF